MPGVKLQSSADDAEQGHEPALYAHRMAVAMFWGVALSLMLWAAFLAIVL